MEGWDIYAIRPSFKRALGSLVSFQTAWEERKRPWNKVVVKHVMRCTCMEKKAPLAMFTIIVSLNTLFEINHLLYVYALLYLSSRNPIQ